MTPRLSPEARTEAATRALRDPADEIRRASGPEGEQRRRDTRDALGAEHLLSQERAYRDPRGKTRAAQHLADDHDDQRPALHPGALTLIDARQDPPIVHRATHFNGTWRPLTHGGAGHPVRLPRWLQCDVIRLCSSTMTI